MEELTLSTSVFSPPRSPSILQERHGHSPGNVLLGSPKLWFMTISLTSPVSPWLVFLETFGLSQSRQRWNSCQVNTMPNLIFQSHLEEDLKMVKQRKHCRIQRPDSCSSKGKPRTAVRFSSITQTRSNSVASTLLCRW